MPVSSQQSSFNYQVPTATNVQTFTSSGIWRKPPGVTFVRVCAWGGGGGGGSGKVCGGGGYYGGAGGGGGGRVSFTFPAAVITNTVVVTVGAGGAGGAAVTACTGNAGSCGGNSSFGTYVVAAGGKFGVGAVSAGASTGGDGGGPICGRGVAYVFTQSNTATNNNSFKNALGFAGAAASTVTSCIARTAGGNAEWGGGAGGASILGGAGVGGAGGSSIWGPGGGGVGANYFYASCRTQGGLSGAVTAGGSNSAVPTSNAATQSGNGGRGGTQGVAGVAGGLYGGGGGGGGGANTGTSGAGGNGGCGAVIVYSW